MEIKNEINETDVFKKSKDVIFRIIAGESILLDLRSSIYYSLNEVGTEIWKRINDENNVMQIANQIYTLYEHAVEYQVILNDIRDLIADLNSEGLIKKIS